MGLHGRHACVQQFCDLRARQAPGDLVENLTLPVREGVEASGATKAGSTQLRKLRSAAK